MEQGIPPPEGRPPQPGEQPPRQDAPPPPQGAQPQPPPPPPRTSRAGFWIAVIFGILLLFSAGMNMFLLVGLAMTMGVERHGEFKAFTDEYYSDARAKDKIAVIRVEGLIDDMDKQAFLGTILGQLSTFKGQLAAVQSDPNVKAVILEVNSPGGYVTASDEMHHLLTEFKKKSGLPVIVFMKDVAASGGYYISAPADKIVAMPTCTTGSIGVIAMLINVQEGLGNIGVKVHTIKSGKMKDAGSPFKDFTDEDRQYFQKHIDSMYARFLEVVYEGRRDAAGWKDDAALREIADGRAFSAAEAKANGLIDEIGYFEKAVEIAKAEAGLTNALVVRYRYVPPPSIFGLGGANTTTINTGVNINLDTGNLPEIDSPRFLYMWKP